jgi:hypothetical protein
VKMGRHYYTGWIKFGEQVNSARTPKDALHGTGSNSVSSQPIIVVPSPSVECENNPH